MNPAYIINFPFLNQRFKHAFFCKFLNRYLLFILEAAERLQLRNTEMTKAFLSLLYSDPLEVLDPYDRYYLKGLVYKKNDKGGKSEINYLQNYDLFVLAFMHILLSDKAISKKRIQEELFRLTGLFIVNQLPHLKRERLCRVRLLIPNGDSIRFSTPYIRGKSIWEFQKECRYAAKLSDSFGIGARSSYVPETEEFLKFLDEFQTGHKKYLTAAMKEAISTVYEVYRMGKQGTKIDKNQ